MNYLCGKMGRNPFSRLLSLLTSAVVSLSLFAGMLVIPVKADTADVTVDQMVTALNELNTELEAMLQQRFAEHGGEPTELETVPAEDTDIDETQEPIDAPHDELENGIAFVAEALTKVQGERSAVYLSQSVLDDIKACTKAVKAKTGLEDKAADAIEQVSSSAYLEEPIKDSYITAIEQAEQTVEQLPDDPVSLLENEFSSLETGTDEEKQTASDAVQNCCNEILNQERLVAGYSVLIELLPDWSVTEKKISEVSRGLSSDSSAPVVETATLSGLMALMEQSNALKESMAGAVTADQQKELMDSMKQLTVEMDTFLYSSFARNAVEDARQQTQLEKTEAKAERTSKLVMVGYISLVVAILAITMGIIAAVCAARKPKKEAPDFHVVASREDAEALEKQHVYLKSQQELQERRISALNNELKQAQMQIDALSNEIRQMKVQPIMIPESTLIQPPPLEAPRDVTALPQKKGMLKLNYQQTCPANSLLYLRDSGPYILYTDDMVGLGQDILDQSCTLSSWRATGLLYLFNAVLDGCELDCEKDSLPGDYYKITGVSERAKVRKGFRDDYALVQKGKIDIARA